jgi:hypothetical protein
MLVEWRCDNILPGLCCRARQEVDISGYGAMVEWWPGGKLEDGLWKTYYNGISSTKNLTWNHLAFNPRLFNKMPVLTLLKYRKSEYKTTNTTQCMECYKKQFFHKCTTRIMQNVSVRISPAWFTLQMSVYQQNILTLSGTQKCSYENAQLYLIAHTRVICTCSVEKYSGLPIRCIWNGTLIYCRIVYRRKHVISMQLKNQLVFIQNLFEFRIFHIRSRNFQKYYFRMSPHYARNISI